MILYFFALLGLSCFPAQDNIDLEKVVFNDRHYFMIIRESTLFNKPDSKSQTLTQCPAGLKGYYDAAYYLIHRLETGQIDYTERFISLECNEKKGFLILNSEIEKESGEGKSMITSFFEENIPNDLGNLPILLEFNANIFGHYCVIISSKTPCNQYRTSRHIFFKVDLSGHYIKDEEIKIDYVSTDRKKYVQKTFRIETDGKDFYRLQNKNENLVLKMINKNILEISGDINEDIAGVKEPLLLVKKLAR